MQIWNSYYILPLPNGQVKKYDLLLIFLLQLLEHTLQYTGHPNLNRYYTVLFLYYRPAGQEYWQYLKMTHLRCYYYHCWWTISPRGYHLLVDY